MNEATELLETVVAAFRALLTARVIIKGHPALPEPALRATVPGLAELSELSFETGSIE